MKMFGLAAIAAVAAMALIGVSSASAFTTVLCKENVLVCPAGQKLENVTLTALSTNFVLLTNIADVKCTDSVISGTMLTLASPLVGDLSLVDFTTCKESVFNSKCTVNTNNAGILKLLKTGPNEGTLLVEGVELLLDCPTLTVHCIYSSPTTALGFSGSIGTGLATFVAGGLTLPKKMGGFFCPNTSFWDAGYTVTTPDPFYVSE